MLASGSGTLLQAILAFDRTAYTEEVVRVLKDAGVGTVAMAGFMTVLAPPAFATFPDRILNTHPSLLPAFPGAHAVRDALAFGVKHLGNVVNRGALDDG